MLNHFRVFARNIILLSGIFCDLVELCSIDKAPAIAHGGGFTQFFRYLNTLGVTHERAIAEYVLVAFDGGNDALAVTRPIARYFYIQSSASVAWISICAQS